MQQCREGWHLETEPEFGPDDEGQADERESERRVRSTRRRHDAPDLPRLRMEDRTIGRVFTAPGGRTYRPSMFLTLTLPSYGRVTTEGVPIDPERYDYRRAALDALHFSKLVDRFWQNLRRCAGYQVQYFPRSNPSGAWLPTCMRRSGARSPAGSCGRCGPPPTTRSGGQRMTSPCTSND
jgi:hypothetical protein